jgi:hypothetical protein
MGMLAAVQRVQKKLDACGNYVANTESEPTEVLFANGRTVKIVAGNLVIGWDKRRAATVFEGIAPPPDECCHAQNSHMEKP